MFYQNLNIMNRGSSDYFMEIDKISKERPSKWSIYKVVRKELDLSRETIQEPGAK